LPTAELLLYVFMGVVRTSLVTRASSDEGRSPKEVSYIIGGVDMSNVTIMRGAECEQILLTAIEKNVPAIMSYLSNDRWHVAKVLPTELAVNRLSVEGFGSGKKPHPINIQLNQPVGISFKYSYGKFVFDTTVIALEPSPDPICRQRGGTIVLAVPDRIEVLQRRSYFRVHVPESLSVHVTLWHRSGELQDENRMQGGESREPSAYYQGKLIDISAGGAQVELPCQTGTIQSSCGAQRLAFRIGQFMGLRFTPMPYETPIMFNAQIRNILPAEDNKSVYLGLQIVGLEASPEGQQVLSRIVAVVERYYQINQSSGKQLDMHGVPAVSNPVAKQALVTDN